MRVFTRALFITLTWWAVVTTSQAAVEVQGVRMWPAPDNTRLVFDLTGPVDHTLFTLKNPQRIVLDIRDTRMAASLQKLSYQKTLVKNIRYAKRDRGDLRVVLDLRASVRPKSFVLKPHGDYGHRLVLDLYDTVKREALPVKRKKARPDKPRDIVIAIDAGHGGDDPGAIGRRGTREKTVVLAIARKLEKLLRKEPGMRPVMIRKGDYYLSLKKRVDIARRNHADLFISIHADAFRSPRARGSSVFILSDNGASSEVAKFLADSENSADLIGGVSLEDKDDLLKMVLVDMVQNSTIEESHEVASHILKQLRGVNHLHKRRVEQAGFRVLKAPDVPSILVETAFISNPKEEKRLRTAGHQQAMARAILSGVRNYFRHNPLPGTLLAMNKRKHVISAGETLSSIAQKYRISVAYLRQSNSLRSDRLRVGDILRIPYSGT